MDLLRVLNWAVPIILFILLIGHLAVLTKRDQHLSGGDANAPRGCAPMIFLPFLYVVFLILWMLFFHRIYE